MLQKSFRCLGNQENTGIIEVRESDITVHLTQARDLFQPHNTFNLRITTYRKYRPADGIQLVVTEDLSHDIDMLALLFDLKACFPSK
jgi:hypothetical protein